MPTPALDVAVDAKITGDYGRNGWARHTIVGGLSYLCSKYRRQAGRRRWYDLYVEGPDGSLVYHEKTVRGNVGPIGLLRRAGVVI